MSGKNQQQQQNSGGPKQQQGQGAQGQQNQTTQQQTQVQAPTAEQTPAQEPAAAESVAAPEAPKDSTLPSTTFPTERPKETDEEKKTSLPELDAKVKAAVNTLVDHLVQSSLHWKNGIPESADGWQHLFMQVLSNTKPAQGQPDLEAARKIVSETQIVVRIYSGPTHEKIVIVRDMASTYLRSEILPWTLAK